MAPSMEISAFATIVLAVIVLLLGRLIVGRVALLQNTICPSR